MKDNVSIRDEIDELGGRDSQSHVKQIVEFRTTYNSHRTSIEIQKTSSPDIRKQIQYSRDPCLFLLSNQGSIIFIFDSVGYPCGTECKHNSISYIPAGEICGMYIGIGILTASLSFILYHRFYSSSSSSSGKPYPYSFDEWKRTFGIAGLRFRPRSSKLDGRKASGNKERDDDQDNNSHAPRREVPITGVGGEGEGEEASTSRFEGSSSLPSFALTPDDEGKHAGGISHDVGSQKTPPAQELSKSQPAQPPSQPSHPRESLPETTGLLMPPPARPAPNAKRKPSTAALSASTLMPPPPLPSSSRSRPASTQPRRNPPPGPPSSSTRPPTTLLQPPLSRPTSTLRSTTIASSSQPPSLSTSTLPSPLRPSKKVILEPGHSPLDWAFLVQHPPTPTFLRGASAGPSLIKVSPALLRAHNGRRGANAWGVWQGKVYNLTPYLKFHPGGVGEILRAAGKTHEGEKLFMEVHPWVSWEAMLGECLVGVLVGEGEGEGEGEGGLDEMD